MGCSAHSWGTNEAWNFNLASNGGEVYGPSPEAALPELAHVSDEPHANYGLCRFLRGSNDHISDSVCFCDSQPRTSSSNPFCSNCKSHVGRDGPATPGSLPLGLCFATVSMERNFRKRQVGLGFGKYSPHRNRLGRILTPSG